jgi:DNA replication protein DnaC
MSGADTVLNNYRMYAGLLKRQYSYYLENTKPAEGQEKAFEAVRAFTYSFIDGESPAGLLLVGGVGSGKTFMVSSVVNNIIDTLEVSEREAESAEEKHLQKGYGFWYGRSKLPVLFVGVTDLLNQFRSYFNKPEDDISHHIMGILQSVELLILDDLGAEKSSDWVSEKLFEIIDYRYNQELPMLVTTNLVPEELKKQIGARNFDRLREMCALVAVTAESQRPTAMIGGDN